MGVGRPTLFKEEYADQVERLCRIGAIDEDIAEFFGVAISTVYLWKNEHPEFSEAIKAGKAKADREVSEKLIERAMGQTLIEEKEVKLKSVEYEGGKKVSEEERVEIVQLKKQIPADTTAIIFFLKNRRPDLWRDKQTIEHSANADAPPVFTLRIDNG